MTLRAKFWVWSFCSTLYRQRLKVLLLDVQRASSSLLLPRLPAPPSLPFPSLFLSVNPHKHNTVNTTLLLVWLKWYLPARNVGTGHGSCHIWKHLPSRLNSWSLFRFFFFYTITRETAGLANKENGNGVKCDSFTPNRLPCFKLTFDPSLTSSSQPPSFLQGRQKTDQLLIVSSV